jgi:hypothetical protein
MSKYSFSDYLSIKNTGLQQWADQFHWPIAYHENVALQNIIKDVFNEHILSKSITSQQLLINYKIYVTLYKNLFELLLLRRVETHNLTTFLSDKTSSMFYLQNNGEFINTSYYSLPRSKNFIKSILINHKISLKANTFIIPFSFSTSAHVLIQSYSSLTLDFLKSHNYLNVIPYNANEFKFEQSFHEDAFINEAKIIIERINDRISFLNISLNVKQKQQLIQILYNAFNISKIIELNLIKNPKTNKIKNLFIASNNNPISRNLSSIVLSNGGNVFGFHHGHPFVIESDLVSWLELTLCNNFVHFSDNLAVIQKETYSRFPALNGNRPEFLGSKTKLFDSIYKKNTKTTRQIIKPLKILVAGVAYPRNNNINIDFPYFHECLYLEFSIIRDLKKAGYEVFYKKHPEGYFINNGNPFENFTEILDGDFDLCLKSVDCVIFHSYRSSAFTIALMNSVPIVCFNNQYDRINPLLMETLKRNVHIIDTYFDELNRLQYPKNLLFNALKNLNSLKPFEYYNSFLSSLS